MIVEADDWCLGSLTDESTHDYRIHHEPSTLHVTFDQVHVQHKSRYRITLHLYGGGQVVAVFGDAHVLPESIWKQLMELE